MFCLQCGQTLHEAVPVDQDFLTLEETSDPVLQRAIRDAGNNKTEFRPVAAEAEVPAAQPEPVKAKAASVKAEHIRQKARPEVRPETAAAERRRKSFVSLHAVVMAPRALSPAGMFVTAPAGAAGGTEAETASEEVVVRPQAAKAADAVRPRHKTAVRGWLAGLGLFVAAAGFNAWAGNYYADRVYPGVKVGNVSVGGWTFAQLEERLPGLLSQPALAGDISGRRIPLEVGQVAPSLEEAVLRQVKEIGRQAPLPGAGLLQSLVAAPVQPNYTLSDNVVDRAVAQLAAQVERVPSDAFITTVDGNVLVIADKPGAKLDRAATAAAIRSAYGLVSAVSIKTEKIPAKVTATDLAAQKAAAEALMAQPPQLTVRKEKYTPTAAQMADWIVFNGPGQALGVDPAAVAAYVASLPGKFDRVQATAALTAAAAKPAVALTASTKRVTAAPKPASTAPARPIASYNYCTQAKSADAKAEIATIMGQSGWTLGGRIKYNAVETGCNFEINIAEAKVMAALDPACGTQSSCRIHNELAINAQQWAAPPASWKTGAAAYRAELVGQVVGQWLGFDHASCQAPATAAPIAQATINVPGCSPQWHPVPAEMQDTKVLSGF